MILNHARVICIGECMVEFYEAKDGSWLRGFAGDTLNVAWVLRAVLPEHIKIIYLTRIGSDQISQDMLGFFQKIGLNTEYIQFDRDRTVGLYTISVDERGERIFSYWRGESAAKRFASDLSSLYAATKKTDLIYLSGITAAITDLQGRKNILSCLRTAKANGSCIAYDPNYRQKLWCCSDEMREFTTEIIGLADIILPTFADEVDAFGDGSKEDTFRRLSALGCNEVVLKDGIKPTQVKFSEGQLEIEVSCPKAPIDTTGAGDSFNGAYLAARLNGQNILHSVQKAQTVSANVVMNKGALVTQEILQNAFRKQK